MAIFRALRRAGLAGAFVLAAAGLARAQTTGYSSSGGSSIGGSSMGGSVGGGGGGGVTGGSGVIANQLTGGPATGFITGAGQMVAPTPTTTARTSTYFNNGT